MARVQNLGGWGWAGGGFPRPRWSGANVFLDAEQSYVHVVWPKGLFCRWCLFPKWSIEKSGMITGLFFSVWKANPIRQPFSGNSTHCWILLDDFIVLQIHAESAASALKLSFRDQVPQPWNIGSFCSHFFSDLSWELQQPVPGVVHVLYGKSPVLFDFGISETALVQPQKKHPELADS